MAPSPVHPLIVSVLLHASYDCVASSDVLVWRIWACRLRHWEASSFETDDPGSDLCQGPEVGALTATLMSAAWVVATAFCVPIPLVAEPRIDMLPARSLPRPLVVHLAHALAREETAAPGL